MTPRSCRPAAALSAGALGAAALGALALTAGCAGASSEVETRAVQPGAPGAPTRTLTAAEVAGVRAPRVTAVDVQFMQGMIPHHGQALEMAALVPSRAEHEGIRLLARRIEISQREEIALMERWLGTHAAGVLDAPTSHAAHGSGMLTPEEVASLAAAQGPTFERRFLELMIRHHEGALAMVGVLMATPGAALEGTIFALAAEVDGGQRIEIERMRGMLATLP